MEKSAAGLVWTLKVQVDAHREDDTWVAICPALDVASQGDTREHAFEMLQEALIGYFECLSDLGTLWQVLDEKRLAPTVAAVLRRATPEEAEARWLDVPIWLLPDAADPQAAVR